MDHVTYKNMVYPVRDCSWTVSGATRIVRVGSEKLSDALNLNCSKGIPCDSDAVGIDNMIAYYIPDVILISSSDDEILDYIRKEIDEDVMDIFA